MVSRFVLAFGLLGSTLVQAAVPEWGQCGGKGYIGETECASGLTCYTLNEWYSQCFHVTGPSSTLPSPTAITTSTRTSTTPTTPSSCSPGALAPRSTGYPIKAATSGTPVFNLNLQRTSSTGNAAILSTSTSSPGWGFANGYIGYAYNILCKQYWYLNITPSTTSYKPLTFDFNLNVTPYWSPVSGSTFISTQADSPYGEVSDFLACDEAGIWKLYLQTGLDVPTGARCALTKLKLLQ